jgi:hypothetical protein
MPRTGLQQFKVLICETLYLLGQIPVVEPEVRRRKVIHNGVQRPSL